jgi:adenylate cyclase class 2
MQTEIEVKFLDIDIKKLRQRLRELGAVLVQSERLMRRRNLDFPDLRLANEQIGWVRVRDEGGGVTMSYKQTNNYTLNGTQEINLTVDSFDTANEFLGAIGLVEKSYQETKRESWLLNNVQIEIDTWPWIPTFVELEGKSEAKLKQVAQHLGLNWSTHLAGDVTGTYQVYFDIERDDIIRHPRTTFGPIPGWLEAKRRKQIT